VSNAATGAMKRHCAAGLRKTKTQDTYKSAVTVKPFNITHRVCKSSFNTAVRTVYRQNLLTSSDYAFHGITTVSVWSLTYLKEGRTVVSML
jgi:hypothetical protein